MPNTKSNTNQHGNCELKDEEIIKVLEKYIEQAKNNHDNYIAEDLQDAISLINRQKAEVEKLKTGLKVVTDELTSQIVRSKSEARKELAERLKEEMFIPNYPKEVVNWKIDNIVKEWENDFKESETNG